MILLIIGESMKKVLLSLALVVLIILLFIPLIFRLVGKDWYKENKKTLTVVETLNCNKADETLNLTYKNNNPYNLQYLIKGNYVDSIITETGDALINEVLEVNSENAIMNDLKDFSKVTYDESKDVTEFRIDISSYDIVPEALEKYTSKENASTYYANLGFSCTKNVLK